MPDDPCRRLREQLLELSHELGREERELAILAEGNASVDCGNDSFLVKASGASLANLGSDDLCRVHFDPVLAAIDDTSEEQVEQVPAEAVYPGAPQPSVETFMHELCLREPGVEWVGHTHSVAINRILCSTWGAEPFRRHILPETVVVCGTAPAVVPYVDPGLALARRLRTELRRYYEEQGRTPKLILLENHGPVALGSSAREVFNVMLMARKWAEVLWGALLAGGARFLAPEDVAHLDSRLDEAHRRRRLLEERTDE